jgi:ADP-ribose pyrophosphatase
MGRNMKHEIIKEEVVYSGFIKINKLEIEHETFNGDSLKITRELIRGGDSSHVLIVDAKIKKVLMISQFRTGLVDTDNPWSLEAVAGLIDEGQTPLMAAVRECEEETGLVIPQEHFELIKSGHQSFGDASKKAHLFMAYTDLSNVDLNKTHGLDTEGEDIQLKLLSFEDIFIKLKNNEISQLQDIVLIQSLLLSYTFL